MSEYGSYHDPVWERKYIEMKRSGGSEPLRFLAPIPLLDSMLFLRYNFT